ncbi:MAG: hypothetical protein FWG13_03350 [Leptospirales bacterium]|nr:hypothetical protein [Leptospirales bacterium]
MSKFIASISVLYLFCVPAFADSLEKRQKDYALSLYMSGNYFRCIDEIRKGVFYWNADKIESEYFIDCCYFSGKQYHTSITRLRPNDEPRNIMLLSQSLLALGQYGESRGISSRLSYNTGKINNHDILMRRIEPLVYLEDYKSALTELENYKKITDGNETFSALEEKLRSSSAIPSRSTGLSVLFSAIIPGLGQAYSGRYLSGLVSLAGVGGTAFAGALMHRRGEKGLAAGAFFLSAVFYSGNLYSAYNSASEFNARQKKLYRDNLSANIPAYEPLKYLDYRNRR